PGVMGPVGLPLYEEHDIGDTNNTFNLMFIDLNAGNLKKDAIKFPDLSDEGQGAVKVEYSFENLETFAAFNAYGWCLAANQGQGISWTNRLNPAGQTAPGSSGYAVVGIPSVLSTVSIDPEAATTVMGKTLQFTPTALDQKGRQMKDIVFDWASSNEAIGTVNETGYFTALEPGVTTVTASHGEVTGSALVTVIPPQVSSGSSGGGHTSTSVGAASNLKPGESVTLPMSMTAISAVTFTAKNEVKDIMATVAQGSLPRDAEPPAGTVYQYVQATLYKAAETDLTAVQFRFTVPTTWLVEHGCTPEQVTLLRHTADGWQAVPVEALGEENGNAIFSASPDGFSLFAIAATGEVTSVTGDATPQETPAETPTETATTTPASDKTPATPQATPLPVWAAVLAFGVLLLVRRT
ncbi:PGF-pre-PGF domain-containing protein, partial [Methanoculleus sp.]|uniref:PGF-pre-PGF domain-containing protein n=1 Tax=Methanoculleus sp. TaxID=90427 RepID=UPI003210404A